MRTRILSALIVALASMPCALSAQASDVKLDEVMSAQDQVATGVANLSVAQRQSLERWLARYTGTVAAVARRIDRAPARETDAPRTDAAPRTEPSRQAPTRQAEQQNLTGRPWLPHKLPNGAQMLRSMDGSTFVMLADGTMWEVYLPHRPQANTWRPGDLIQIRQASIVTGDFDYQLVNGVARSTVSARFAGWVEMKEGESTEGQAPRQ
jgi:hypothetical protein